MSKALHSGLLRYRACAQKRPLLTTMVQSSALLGAGDFLCQSIQKKYEKNQKLNKKRILRLLGQGFLFNGPVLYFNFNKLYPKIGLGRDVKTIMKKVAMIQLLMIPFFTSSFFFI